MTDKNPLLAPFTSPHNAPPFDVIKDEHYLPAVKLAIEEARANIESIKNSSENPTFDNTIAAMGMAGGSPGIGTRIFLNPPSAGAAGKACRRCD